MQNLLIAGWVALAATAAAGCSGCSILSNDRGVLSGTLVDEKALYAVEAADFGAEAAAEAAVDNGLLKGPEAAKADSMLDAAHAALVAARAAYAVGDAQTCAERIAAVQALIADAWALIPKTEA
jgi:hypothetical protein